MVDRSQVLDLLRRNAVYNDLTGSSNGAGYIGGARRRRTTLGSGYIGGCINCANAGCMNCMSGGYKGMSKDLHALLKPKYYEMGNTCELSNRRNKDHFSSVDLANAIQALRLSGKKVKSQRQMDADYARASLKRHYCEPSQQQLQARRKFAVNAKMVSQLMAQGYTKQQAWALISQQSNEPILPRMIKKKF